MLGVPIVSRKAVPTESSPNPHQPASGSGAAIAGHRVRRRWLALLIAAVAVVAIAAFELPQYLSPSSSSSKTTIWQKITAGIADSIVPKDTALEAFAYLYKVQIPGVVVPSGVDGKDAPTSGTGVMRWVQADWSQLSSAQQAVIDRYLPPESTKGTVQMTPAPSAAAFAPAPAALTDALSAAFAPASAPRPAAGLAPTRGVTAFDAVVGPRQPGVSSSAPIGWPFITNVAPDASPDLALAMADDISGIIVHLAPKLGLPVINTPDVTLTLSDTDGGNVLLNGGAIEYEGHYQPCSIIAWKNTWSNAAWTAGDKVGPVLHALLTHEVVHCFQGEAIGDITKFNAMPSWIMEGTAEYLAADDTRVVDPVLAEAWPNYLVSEIPLTNRNYDALGYYSLLAFKGRDMWGTVAKAWIAAANSTQSSDAFIGVLHGDDPDIQDNWAESYANSTVWGDPWVLHGFGAPTDKTSTLHDVQALPSPGWTGSLRSRSNTLLYVKETSGEVVTVSTGGLASVHDSSGDSAIAFQAQSFCTVKSCVCPNGTALAGQDMASAHIDIPFLAAINAPEGGATYRFIGSSLADLCKGQPTPQPQATSAPKGPCGPACSQSNGDPHMTTVNLYHYDFQAAGEFTLLRTPDGSVEIQARQEPYVSSTGATGQVSINTAVAAKVGSRRVGVYVTPSGLEAHVDGKVADLSSGPMDLGNGGRISAVSKGFEIDLPDGTTLWALSVGVWGINAQIHPSPALLTNGQGLLGFVIPGGLGVPALPDGTRLPATSNLSDKLGTIYGKYADAWRITDSASLFDYDPGKSTASYTIKPYPTDTSHASLTDLSADQQTAGEDACSGVSDPSLHDECVFDVGITGQTGFAGNYQATQALYEGSAPAATPTPSAPVATPTAPAATGKFSTIQAQAMGGYAQGPDDTVYMSIQTGDNAFSLISFDPAAGKIVSQVSVPLLTAVHFAAGSVWLPGLETDSNGHNCSITRFDASTLTKQATVAVPCDFSGSVGTVASDGDSIWFTDVSKYDLGTNKGAVMTRIDPATNAPGTAATDTVALPFIGGYVLDSQGAFFYYDSDHGYLVLSSGASSFTSLGKFQEVAPPRAAGAGLWVQANTDQAAEYYTSPGTPAASVPVGGNLVAGDASAAYTEVLGNNASTGATETQLWRYPIDGSTPTQITTAPNPGGGELDYFGDPMPTADGHGILKLWPTRDSAGNPVILLQWTPLS
jgi:hypothetical protein